MTLKETLRKLNKDRSEEEKIQLVSQQKEGYYKRSYTSTGNPYLNYRIKKELGEGGYIKGSYNMLIGGEGSGKTSAALIGAREEQKTTGKVVVIMDGEGALNESHLDRFNLDRDLTLIRQGRNLENMLDEVEAYSKAEDVGMIIIDSIPIFTATKIEEDDASNDRIGLEAKRFTGRMAIIEANCKIRDITLLGLTFYTLDPGAIGDPRKLKRGEWQKYMSNLTLDFTKKDIVFNGNKEPIGHVIDVRVKKSKVNAYNPKEVFQITLYYEDGFNEVDEYFRIFSEEGVIQRKGAYYNFELPDGQREQIQGKEGTVQFLKDNEEIFNYLKSKIT